MSDEKPPRAVLRIPRRRDEYITKTPVRGVPIVERVRAGSQAESFDGDTPVNADSYEVLASRAKRAADSSKDAADNSRGGLIVATEIRSDVARVEGRLDEATAEIRLDVEKLDKRFTVVEGEVISLRVGMAGVNGTLGTLVDELKQRRAEDAASKNDVIEGRKWTRDQIGRFVLAVTSLTSVAAIIAAITKGC